MCDKSVVEGPALRSTLCASVTIVAHAASS